MKPARKLSPIERRLRDLTALDEQIRMAILGHPLHDRYRLEALQQCIRDEIRSLKEPA